MSLVQTVHLTMGNYKSPMVVPAVQNDSDRQLKMIVDDFTLTSSMTGKMTFKRADGTFYEAEATLALADNAFVADLDQALTCPGRTLAQLKVTATDTVSTFSFVIWVESDTSGTLTPQEGISLSEAVQRAEDAADRAEEAAESGGSGLTDNVKQALLQIARKVAYIDEHGQDYYDDLYDALYEVTGLTLDVTSISLGTIGATSQITATTVPPGATVTWSSSDTSVATVVNGLVTAVGYGSATITASAGNLTAQCSVVIAQATVTSISAVYTPSGTIYETNIPALDTLKNDLVVTAHWSNDTTSTVSDYTLSGTLSAGSNTITVSYGGKTTTITVTVVALSSISAVYTQSGTVYDTASLDDLKADLVVTANYADSTTQTVTEYTLSGTLTEGTSTITVSYAGKSATFNVTVTHAVTQYTITNNLTNVSNSNDASRVNELTAYTATLTEGTGYEISSVTITMGGNDITSTAYSNGSISIASVTGDIVITATAVRVYTPVQNGMFLNYDFRNKTLEYYNLTGWGNVYRLVDESENAFLFSSADVASTEYGIANTNWRGMRDVNAPATSTAITSSAFTLSCLYYNTSQPNLSGWGSNLVDTTKVRLNPAWINTDGTSTNVGAQNYDFQRISNGYTLVTYRANGNILDIFYNDTKVATLDASNYEGFSRWSSGSLLPLMVYNTGTVMRYLAYNRALTDAELLDNKDYFDSIKI